MIDRSETNYSEIHLNGDYDSAFEYDSENERRKEKRHDLAEKKKPKDAKKPSRLMFSDECSKEEGRKRRFHFLALDAYSRHKKFVNEYLLCYKGSTSKLERNKSLDKTDFDVLRENHRFLWSDDDDEALTWEQRFAKKYYDKLFKEYCISDLNHYKYNKIALRWRTEQEVIDGKGQFICGEKKCNKMNDLRSWEVNFGYVENGEKKNALVKLRLCPDCSYKLNYHKKRKEVLQEPSQKTGSELDTSRKRLCKEAVTGSSMLGGEKSSSSQNESEKLLHSEADNIWKQPVKNEEEKSREDEFEEYLAEMLL